MAAKQSCYTCVLDFDIVITEHKFHMETKLTFYMSLLHSLREGTDGHGPV